MVKLRSDEPGDGDRGTIQLCLVNNNPTSTLLITTSGQPLYSIATPAASKSPSEAQRRENILEEVLSSGLGLVRSKSLPSPAVSTILRRKVAMAGRDNELDASCSLSTTTTIKRLDDFDVSTGHVETTVGILRSSCSSEPCQCRSTPRGERDLGSVEEAEGEIGWASGGMTLDLCEQNFKLTIAAIPLPAAKEQLEDGWGSEEMLAVDKSGSDSVESLVPQSQEDWVLLNSREQERQEEEVVRDNSWNFIGPDNKSYKWQMLGPAPVLTLNSDTSIVVPVARFRGPKLGIVSRPRKGFLEILPSCPNMDLVVTTFVGFMKQRVVPAIEAKEVADVQSSSSTKSNGSPADSSPSNSRPSSPWVWEPLPRGRSAPSPNQSPSPPGSQWQSPSSSLRASPSPLAASSVPRRFHSIADLARKYSRSPPASAITFPPFAVKPKVRPLPTSNVVDADS